jgi:hypothetical protein
VAHRGGLEFSLECVNLLGRDRITDEKWLDQSLAEVQPSRPPQPVKVGALQGREVLGKNKAGRLGLYRVFVEGDSLFIASVLASPEQFELPVAEAFISSLAYEATWRLYVVPEASVAVAAPRAAVVLAGPAMGIEPPSVARGFAVLGPSQMVYTLVRGAAAAGQLGGDCRFSLGCHVREQQPVCDHHGD